MIDGPTIEPRDIEAGLSNAAGRDPLSSADLPLGDGFSLTKHLEDVQRRFLARAMQEAEGKKTVAAKLLGYPNYQTLAAQLERLSVDWGGE